MQQKESKTNWHFRISIAKSIVRILAGIALMCVDGWYFNAAGGLLRRLNTEDGTSEKPPPRY